MISPSTGPLPALRRLLAAPWLIVGLGLVHVALAAAVAAPVRAVVRAAMGPFFHEAQSRLFGPLIELLGSQRAAPAALPAAVIVAAAVALLIGPLLAGAAIQRLAGPCKLGDQARAALGHYLANFVVGLYGVILRLLLLLVAAALGSIHVAVQLVLTAAVLTFAAAAVDVTRARVVLAGARGFHPRTFVRAVQTVAQDPRLWLRSAAASLLALVVASAILLVTLHGLGTAWAAWVVRALGFVATFAALWRLAIAVEYATPRDGA